MTKHKTKYFGENIMNIAQNIYQEQPGFTSWRKYSCGGRVPKDLRAGAGEILKTNEWFNALCNNNDVWVNISKSGSDSYKLLVKTASKKFINRLFNIKDKAGSIKTSGRYFIDTEIRDIPACGIFGRHKETYTFLSGESIMLNALKYFTGGDKIYGNDECDKAALDTIKFLKKRGLDIEKDGEAHVIPQDYYNYRPYTLTMKFRDFMDRLL